jgi:hypothetical protein
MLKSSLIFPKLNRIVREENYYEFDCGDLWLRKNVDTYEDFDKCAGLIIEDLNETKLKNFDDFGMCMDYTAPYPTQLKCLKENKNKTQHDTESFYLNRELLKKTQIEGFDGVAKSQSISLAFGRVSFSMVRSILHNEDKLGKALTQINEQKEYIVDPENLNFKTMIYFIKDTMHVPFEIYTSYHGSELLIRIANNCPRLKTIIFTMALIDGGFLATADLKTLDSYENKNFVESHFNLDFDLEDFIFLRKQIKPHIEFEINETLSKKDEKILKDKGIIK